MNVPRLILHEIAYRKVNSLLWLLSVSVAVGCLVGALTLLDVDETQTRSILAQKEQAVEDSGKQLEEAMRKITKGLGFNLLILPEDQDLNELHLEGTLSSTMPEAYVERLAASEIVTINHLLPAVTQKILWSEMSERLGGAAHVRLIGTRGEVPIMHRDPKKPILDAVPPKGMVVGYEIAQALNLTEGNSVPLMGRTFHVVKTHEQRGTTDDSTVWINLRDAQAMLGMENLIHSILALECHCAGERIAQIRREVAAILPGTQVVERRTRALARAEARDKATQTAREALEQEIESRAQLRSQRELFAALFVPLALLGCAMSIAMLAMNNVRERSGEIAILRAIGVRSGQVLVAFLGKAIVVGLAAGLIGYAAGYLAIRWSPIAAADSGGLDFSLPRAGLALVVAPLLSMLAGWVPAVLAARQDPAVVLQKD